MNNRKKNNNCILFLFVSSFLILCILSFFSSQKFYWLIVDNAVLLRDRKVTLSLFCTAIEDEIADTLPIRSELIDLNSLVMRYTGTEVVVKEDMTVVRTGSGLLAGQREFVSDEEINRYVDSVYELYSVSQELGIPFLYVQAPGKGYEETYPGGVANFEKSNYDRYAGALSERGIPLLNMRGEMLKDGMSDKDLFFITENHWTPEAGFWAFGKICEKLNYEYGFEYDAFYTDINNYETVVYENRMLGNLGKKVGRYFTPEGLDDFSLIIPRFATDLEEEHLYGTPRSGSFSETVLFLDGIEQRNYYDSDLYYTYSGGKFKLQTMRNNLQPDGKKILLIRDSYACTVAPFLLLVSSEIRTMDLRTEYRDNILEYMSEMKPDYVIVLYNSIDPSDDRFDFGYFSIGHLIYE